MIIGFIIGFITGIILLSIGGVLYLKKLKIKDFAEMKEDFYNTYDYDCIYDDLEEKFYYSDEDLKKD